MRLREVEAGGLKRPDDASVFEVVSDKDHVRRLSNLRLSEPAPLLGLRRRIIELEDAHVLGRLEAIGESIETRAHDQDLPDAFFNGSASRVLGETAAHGDEQAQGPPLRPFPGERDRALGVLPQDRKRERIGEHEAALEHLMRRPMSGRAKRGHACLSLLHWARR